MDTNVHSLFGEDLGKETGDVHGSNGVKALVGLQEVDEIRDRYQEVEVAVEELGGC